MRDGRCRWRQFAGRPLLLIVGVVVLHGVVLCIVLCVLLLFQNHGRTVDRTEAPWSMAQVSMWLVVAPLCVVVDATDAATDVPCVSWQDDS